MRKIHTEPRARSLIDKGFREAVMSCLLRAGVLKVFNDILEEGTN
jgi:hypothetical protein